MLKKSAYLQIGNSSAPRKRGRPPGFRPALDVRTVVRSEGQRLLLEVEGSVSTIAKACGSSEQVVRLWRRGETTPAAGYRAALEAAFDIQGGLWDVPPGAPAPPRIEAPRPVQNAPAPQRRGPKPAVPPRPPVPVRTTLEEVNALIKATKSEAAAAGGLRASERVKLNDTLAKLLALRSRLEQAAEMSEDRMVREHPAWHRIRRAVIGALVKHPEAARAVEKALAALEGKP